MGTGRTFRNIKERQTVLLLTLEPTQTIISAARAWKIIYSRKAARVASARHSDPFLCVCVRVCLRGHNAG